MSSQDSININHEMFKNLKVDELKYWDTIIVKLKNKKMSDGIFGLYKGYHRDHIKVCGHPFSEVIDMDAYMDDYKIKFVDIEFIKKDTVKKHNRKQLLGRNAKII